MAHCAGNENIDATSRIDSSASLFSAVKKSGVAKDRA
jgi:hypothetical protein